VTKGYLITAAKSSGPKLNNDQPFPRNTPDSVVFWLSGRKKGKPTLFAKILTIIDFRGMKREQRGAKYE
jgi:hypothetical protein